MRDPTLYPQPATDASPGVAQWMSTLTARMREALRPLYDNYRGARVDTYTLANLPPTSDHRIIEVSDATSGPKYCVSISGAWKTITTGTTVS